MLINFETKPLQIHEAFHRSTAYERMNFGAFGSGKTYAVIDESIAWCLEQPGIRGMITRKTIPELRDTTEPIFAERLPAELWNAGELRRAGGHYERFTFPNGSIVLFRSIDDWNKHRSLNLGFLAYDECNEFDEETYVGMSSRVRQSDLTAEARRRGYTGRITRRGIWGATNPAGKDWLYQRFHTDSPSRKAKSEMFISTTLDNPYLPPEYVDDLLTMPKPWVQRYVLCQFDDFAGRIYEDWGWDTHTIEHPDWTKLDPGQLFWMSVDPGTESPTAGLWVWNDVERSRLVGVAEYEEPGLAVDTHTAAWRRIEANERMNIRWRVGDPNSITQRDRGTMRSLQSQYAGEGFHFSLGASSESDRIPALGQLITQQRFVVSRRCVKTFEAIRDYQWQDLTPAQRSRGEDPQEKPLKKNTHLVECAQYLASRKVPMKKILKRHNEDDFQDEIHRTIKKHQAAKRGARPATHDLGGAV